MSVPPHPTTCLIIPVLNGGASAARVARAAREHALPIVIVDDGSTDSTAEELSRLEGVHVVRHPRNLGKGAAIATGLAWARERGHARAITIDGDGQHDPGDIPRLEAAARSEAGAIVIGARDMAAGGAPLRSRVGLALSNAWLAVLAGRSLPDSQSGFRSYPVAETLALGLSSPRFEFEFDALLRGAIAGVPIRSVPVSVRYPGNGAPRSSHFRPLRDSLRILWRGAWTRISWRRQAP